MNLPTILSFLICLLSIQNVHLSQHNSNGQIQEPLHSAWHKNKILIISTLDGDIHAVSQVSGDILWTLNETQRIKVSPRPRVSAKKLFLPDPRDGSLYYFHVDHGIRKLPRSIPDLVRTSPSKSVDGVFYTGKKTASWLVLNPLTGERVAMDGDAPDSTCPFNDEHSLLIPRTEYSISLYDSNSKEHWNATYMHYGFPNAGIENIYDDKSRILMASSNSGNLISINTDRKKLEWCGHFKSPVVGIWTSAGKHIMPRKYHSLPGDAIQRLLKKDFAQLPDIFNSIKESESSVKKRGKETKNSLLFVGRFRNEMYAIPSVSTGTVMQPSATGNLPDEEEIEMWADLENWESTGTNALVAKEEEQTACFVPINQEQFDSQAHSHPPLIEGPVSSSNSVEDEGDHGVEMENITHVEVNEADKVGVEEVEKKNESDCLNERLPFLELVGFHEVAPMKPVIVGLPDDAEHTSYNTLDSDYSFMNVPQQALLATVPYWNSSSLVLAVLLGLLIGSLSIVIIMYFAPNIGFTSSRRSNNSLHGVDTISVGKIEYQPNKLLGRGCDGTCVFKGFFDNREVAVKRLLPDCFSLADREVELLKDADMHPNVIRYFCTETDSQFRYIALELCNANLTDFVEKKIDLDLDARIILQQAMNGLKHLHTLNIVHRDIKPQNVLLAFSTNVGTASQIGLHNVGDHAQEMVEPSRIRVLISDFGLCKKVNPGRVSVTRHTGLIGTEGWIAPELIVAQRKGETAKVNKAMDIFSSGCVFYYVLSGGRHPFGDDFSRQANIVYNKTYFEILEKESEYDQECMLALHLIRQMLAAEPSDRPLSHCVLSHPYFWSLPRRLAFLQDLSDRIEKEEHTSPVVRALERYRRYVVRNDWLRHIGHELQKDLQSRRSYRKDSVRDLLRAIRNKKHHYCELKPSLQEELGTMPEGFLTYFCTRFSLLFLHSYIALQMFKNESLLGAYYSEKTVWNPPKYPIPDSPALKHNPDSDAFLPSWEKRKKDANGGDGVLGNHVKRTPKLVEKFMQRTQGDGSDSNKENDD